MSTITVTNNIRERVEHWSDPGDYPSGAGGGPLPDRATVELAGHIVVDVVNPGLEFRGVPAVEYQELLERHGHAMDEEK